MFSFFNSNKQFSYNWNTIFSTKYIRKYDENFAFFIYVISFNIFMSII